MNKAQTEPETGNSSGKSSPIVSPVETVTNCNILLSSTLMGKPLLDGFVVPETVITEEDCKIVSVTVSLKETTDILYNPVSRRLTFKYHDEV